MSGKSYTASDITTLDGVKHVRLRPSMYLGEHMTSTATREVIDNAIDEVSRGYASRVSVEVSKDGVVTVIDDGRGLPVDSDARGVNGIVKTIGTTNSGSNFSSDTVTAGTHGVGASATVAISSRVDVTVIRGNKVWEQSFKDGAPGTFDGGADTCDPTAAFTPAPKGGGKLTSRPRGAGESTMFEQGTRVRFRIDTDFVGDDDFRVDELRTRMGISAASSPNPITVRFIDPEGIAFEFVRDMEIPATVNMLSEAGGVKVDPDASATWEFPLSYKQGRHQVKGTVEVTASLADTGADPVAVSATNGVYNPGNGSHVTGTLNGLTDALATYRPRLGKEYPVTPTGSDYIDCLNLAVSLRMPEPPFKQQAKSEVGTAAMTKEIGRMATRVLVAWTKQPANADLLLAWAQRAATHAAARLAGEEAAARAASSSGSSRVREGSNLDLPAKFLPSEVTGADSGAEFFPVEGDSAAGTTKAARDARFQAIYPLRGKLLSTYNVPLGPPVKRGDTHNPRRSEKDPITLRSNATCVALERILGSGFGSHANMDKRRFDRVIVATDADPDGADIASQILSLLYYHGRAWVDEGRFFVAQPPLFIVTSRPARSKAKSDVTTHYCINERERDLVLDKLRGERAQDIRVQRCKGLGEMNADAFAETVMDPSTRKLLRVVVDEGADEMMELYFGDDASLRRDWITRNREHIAQCEAEGRDPFDPTGGATPYHVEGVGDVVDVPISQWLHTRQLEYALYTISDRAIPRASDGLKKGQRRLLYSMLRDKVTADAKPKKSARLVNSATSQFHPHGGAAMYGTMVTLGVPYGRLPLVRPTGSFGKNPGDDPAAERYTEAQLSDAGMLAVQDVDSGAVPMVPTYDSETVEPDFLPTRIPLSAILGVDGTAVGFASKIPSHNPVEVLDATMALVEQPEISDDDLYSHILGPDWGTGGIVTSPPKAIRAYLENGKGNLTVRARYSIDGRVITITELPPGVSLSKLTKAIVNLVTRGTVQGVADFADHSDLKHTLRLRVTCKRGADPHEVVRQLMVNTDLQSTYAPSFYLLDDEDVPYAPNMRRMLTDFIDMRDGCIQRSSQSELDTVKRKAAIAEGRAAAIDRSKEIVAILQDSADRDEGRDRVAELLGVSTEVAAEVVALPMYTLTKGDSHKLRQQVRAMHDRIAELEALVTQRSHRMKLLHTQLQHQRDIFAADPVFARRTELSPEPKITLSGDKSDRNIDRLHTFRVDDLTASLTSDSHGTKIGKDQLVWAVLENGKVKLMHGKGIPRSRDVVPLIPNGDTVVACGALTPGKDRLFIVTAQGKVLALDTSQETGKFNAQGAAGNGVAGIKLAEDDQVVAGFAADDTQILATVSLDGFKATRLSDIPTKGRGAGGVMVHKLRKDDPGVTEVGVGDESTVAGWDIPVTPRSKATATGSKLGVVYISKP